MKTKSSLKIILALGGVLMVCIGGIAMKTGWFGDYKALAGILIGVGCGLFGHNFGSLIEQKFIKSNPNYARKVNIEKRDERNIAINNAAKGKAFDAMGYIYAAVTLICVLINTDFLVIILLVVAYLLVQGSMIYHLTKLNKEM